MKKVIFSTLFVFALVFSFGNSVHAQTQIDQTLLQQISHQIESLRMQLGGLVGASTSRATVTTLPEPSTERVYCTGTVVNGSCVGDIVTEIECKNHPERCPSWTIMNRTASPVIPTVVGVRATAPASISMETLRPGARGERVLEIQKLLQLKGLYTGVLDGIYGRGMSAAVSAFQQSKGLTPDGIAGPKTLASFWGTSWGEGVADATLIQKESTAPVIMTDMVKMKILSQIILDGFSAGRYQFTCKLEGMLGGSYDVAFDNDPSGGTGSFNVYKPNGSIAAKCTAKSVSSGNVNL